MPNLPDKSPDTLPSASPGTSPAAPSGTSLASLSDLRDRIDQVDRELLSLLNQRADLSLRVGQIKVGMAAAPVFCPEREQQLLAALQQNNQGPLPNTHLLRIYTEILSSSRELQKPLSVACLGPDGTFSYLAGQAFLGRSTALKSVPCLKDVFAAVLGGQCQLGVVPLENSLQGSVGQSFDLFMRYPVNICAEFFYPVQHSLISLETDLSQIKRVYSHPQPLAQCSDWLQANLPTAALFTANSTAEAAALAAKEEGAAAIAHASLARTHALNILALGIEDQPDNWTRFVLIAPEQTPNTGGTIAPGSNPLLLPGPLPSAEAGNCANSTCPQPPGPTLACPTLARPAEPILKSTLLFGINNKPGSLAAVLNILQAASLNLSKLESRPSAQESWTYNFFADVEADLRANPEVLQELNAHCHFLRLLGVYPCGVKLEAVA